MQHFNRCDMTKPDGCYIQIARVMTPDDGAGRPEEMCDGFWPSRDPKDAGYVSPKDFDIEMERARERIRAWNHEIWYFAHVAAEARCFILRNGTGIFVNVQSPGVGGIESDSDEKYLAEIYEEQVEILKDMLAAFANPIFEEGEVC